MSRLAKPWLIVVAVAMVTTGASGAQADEKSMGADKQQAVIERSWAIQAELAKIEGNREAFVDELLGSWTPYVDSAVYDLRTELRPIAMKATPWQLYGASLVGDFKTMVQLLRGQVGAGRYVNALDKPQARMPVTNVLGGTNNSLVFTPIPPCRIVDTRGTGARTGILAPGVPRVFDLTTDGFTKGQGGDTVCAGLPSFSHFGWAANITAAAFIDNGGLKAYGFSAPAPTSSIINYFPAAFAIANSSALTGCFGCVDDVTISSFGAATHVIIDVVGYYEQATGFAASVGNPVVTTMAGASTSIPINGTVFVTGAACPAGTVLVSGGHSNSSSGATAIWTSDHNRGGGTAWTEFLHNPSTTIAQFATVSSFCIDVI